MKDNKKMSLNIQLFAEKNDGMVTNTETLEENENAQKEAQNQKSEAENKGLPFGYIEDLDYAHETAEHVKEKIERKQMS